jgi:hypothetical protein
MTQNQEHVSLSTDEPVWRLVIVRGFCAHS